MKIAAVLLFIKGGYEVADLINPPEVPTTNPRYVGATWGEKDRQNLIDNCVRASEPLTTKHPYLVYDYCVCAADNIMNNMTKEQYLNSLDKTQAEQMQEQKPFYQSCLDVLKQQVDSVENPFN